MEHVNFNAWIDILTRLTARAQATFMNLYIRQMGPSLCRSVIRYCHKRLEKINEGIEVPEVCTPEEVKELCERL